MYDLASAPSSPKDPLDLAAILRLSTVATLETRGVMATFAGRVAADWSSWRDPIAFVGFGGDRVRGALTVGAPWDFLRTTDPGCGTSHDDLLDWSRELANLLLVSIKAALLPRDVRMPLGLPVSNSGSAVRVHVSGSGGFVQVFKTPCDTWWSGWTSPSMPRTRPACSHRLPT